MAKSLTPREQLFQHYASEYDKQAVRDRLLCDIHDMLTHCCKLWESREQAERGETMPLEDAIVECEHPRVLG